MTARIATEESWDETLALLAKFGVPDNKVSTICSGRDVFVIRAAATWLVHLTPGLRNSRVMEKISHALTGNSHQDHINYLGRNNCIPQLPTEVIEQQQISQFFVAARDILKHGRYSTYQDITIPS